MKKIMFTVFVVASSLCASEISNKIEVGFSPFGNSLNLIIKSINDAQHNIEIATYSFTNRKISKALLDAKDRGVNIKIVADEKVNNRKNSLINFLKNKGVSVCLTDKYAIMHNKFMTFDNETVETGSFNYSYAATNKNAENVILIHDKETAKKYHDEFQRLLNECKN